MRFNTSIGATAPKSSDHNIRNRSKQNSRAALIKSSARRGLRQKHDL